MRLVSRFLSSKNFEVSVDRTGLTRSAVFMILLIMFHADGAYLYVRLNWTGFGFQTNTVESHELLHASLHVFVGEEKAGNQTLA